MRGLPLATLSLLLFSLALTGCSSLPTDAPAGLQSPTDTAIPATDSPNSPLPPATLTRTPAGTAHIGPVPEAVIEKAIADLAERLEIPQDQVSVMDAEAVDWPDASLGCGQPGVAYPQVITPGYRIVLEAAGDRYPYHTDAESQVILCQGDRLPRFQVTPGEIDDGQPWVPVD